MENSMSLTSLVVLILLLPYATATLPGSNAKKHFVLVHKACFGAWSWYKILALMRSSGHNVTAIDLGSSGINPKQTFEIPRFSDYLSPLMEFVASLPANRKVVLVGHELGGLAISKAMETFPETTIYTEVPIFPSPNFSHEMICYVCLSFYIFGTKYNLLQFVNSASQPDNRVIYDNGPTNPPTTFIIGPKYLETNLYQRSPSQDLALATTLVRPIYFYSVKDVSKEIVVSRKRYGSVKRAFIVAVEDKLVKEEFQRLMIEKNPPDEVEEIQGADTMIMISKPQQLFTSLLRIGRKF
ncbi:methyl jasmonate esterase 1-like isoform X1 [Capsicum annuum]|uniref:methyl jasmonate esterase 1-like isoform X1 n=1 Tax=Capsicum annuum TaxID=4072 RepID=UPI001FB0762A|nr:methyl jasmonate esterase 1-like isoform X1 [Capsicum annuum]